MSLPAFWHAATRLTGRLDLLTARALLQPDAPLPTPAALRAAGVYPAHCEALAQGGPLEAPGPFLTLADPGYPEILAQTPYAPPVLFLRGDSALLSAPMVALVGSRRCTSDGLRMAGRLARAVVRCGGVVVSGLAYGIDHACHEASLARTIAVLGQGLEQPLTAQQQHLADRILAHGGLLISELLPTMPATRWTFPQRNRIIAGLARATVVVEAASRSGALITARQALALGREVLAVPGSPLAPASAGCLDLLADGAAMARDDRDIRALLPPAPTGTLPLPLGDSPPKPGLPALPQELTRGLARGGTVEELARAAGWPSHRLAATLAGLELTGAIERLPGDRFCLRYPE